MNKLEDKLKERRDSSKERVAPEILLEVLNNKPTIISFYRGTWCPYCNLELSNYNELLKDRKDINMIAISPKKPDSSIDTKVLNFKVLSGV